MNTPSAAGLKADGRLRPVLWDLLIVALVLALAGALFFLMLPGRQAEGDLVCTVSRDGTVLDSFSPAETQQAGEHIYGDYVVFVEDGRVCIRSAPCSNQDCVHTGWISRPGQSIICLPGRFIVELSAENGAENPDFDIVVK